MTKGLIVYPGVNIWPLLSVEESDVFKIYDDDDTSVGRSLLKVQIRNKPRALAKYAMLNVFQKSIQVLVEVLWKRLGLEWDVLGPSLRSSLLFWLCVVHHIVSKEGSIVLVSRVFWYMELRLGQWRLMIWEVWKGQNVWWWDGCVGCPWRTEGAVRIYATFLVSIVLLMWWDVEDWDGLDIWNVRV